MTHLSFSIPGPGVRITGLRLIRGAMQVSGSSIVFGPRAATILNLLARLFEFTRSRRSPL
jgi:hypothetical protein